MGVPPRGRTPRSHGKTRDCEQSPFLRNMTLLIETFLKEKKATGELGNCEFNHLLDVYIFDIEGDCI